MKKRTLKDFWPQTNGFCDTNLELNDFSCLEYEVLSETFVCENCGDIKHFVS